MSRICVFFGTGYEEIEALTVVDMCRRAKLTVDMVSITGERKVISSHNVTVEMDCLLEEVDFSQVDMIVLPGGMPGTKNLEACEPLMKQVTEFANNGKKVSAICAAPSILGHLGLLKGKKACSYPGFEEDLEGAEVTTNSVEVVENIITSRGMGTAIPFSLAIVESFFGKEYADNLAAQVIFCL